MAAAALFLFCFILVLPCPVRAEEEEEAVYNVENKSWERWLSEEDGAQLVIVCNEQNRYFENLSRLFSSGEGTLLNQLLYQPDSPGKAAGNIIAGIGAVFVLINGAVQVLRMVQRNEHSIEGWIRLFVILASGMILILNTSKILSALDGLGTVLWTEVRDALQLNQNTTVLNYDFAGQTLKAAEKKSFLEKAASFFSFGIGDLMEKMNGKIASAVGNISLYFTFYMIITSCYALLFEMVIRRMFMPMAIADIVTEGFRSPGIRYIKMYFALYVQLAMYFVIIAVSQEVTEWAIQNGGIGGLANGVNTALGSLGVVICTRTAARALMSAASQLSREAVGGA